MNARTVLGPVERLSRYPKQRCTELHQDSHTREIPSDGGLVSEKSTE